jgi:hypothetical protein
MVIPVAEENSKPKTMLSDVFDDADLTLRELDGRDRPLPIVTLDRDAQTMGFVKPNVLHRPGLSIHENHGLADQFSLGLPERAEDR